PCSSMACVSAKGERREDPLPGRSAQEESVVKILCTLKRVPDPEQKVKFKGNTVDYTGTNWVPNQFDEYAVETALRLTENASAGNARTGEVVVASIGPKDVSQQLRSALAMGADRAVLVEGTDDALDADAVARTVM